MNKSKFQEAVGQIQENLQYIQDNLDFSDEDIVLVAGAIVACLFKELYIKTINTPFGELSLNTEDDQEDM